MAATLHARASEGTAVADFAPESTAIAGSVPAHSPSLNSTSKQSSSKSSDGPSGKSNNKSNNTVTMTFHIDPELKREVTEIVKDFGLNLTAVTRAFYKQIVRDGSIPLSFRYDVKGIDDPDVMIGGSSASTNFSDETAGNSDAAALIGSNAAVPSAATSDVSADDATSDEDDVRERKEVLDQ